MPEISIKTRIGSLQADHPVMLDARDELFADLRSAPEVTTTERDVAGDHGKGVFSELVVGLGSAGSLTAFARIVRLWLERDRRRSLTVSITEHESGRVIEIKGEAISAETLKQALDAADRDARGPRKSVEPADRKRRSSDG